MTDNPDDLFGSISISDDQKSAKQPEDKTVSPQKRQKVPKVHKKKSSGGLLKFLILLTAGVGVYAGVGFFLVPYLTKNNLSEYLGEKLNVKLSIRDTRFNPFNFELTLSGISVETNEMGEPQARFLSIAESKIDLDFLSLLRGDLVCTAMDIHRLNAHISRNRNKRYNISYLLDNKSTRSQSGIMDFAELPFLFSLNNIKISDSQVIFDDKSSDKTHHVEAIQLALPAISNFPYQSDTYIHPRFSAVINGSPVKLTGEATLTGTGVDGRQTLLSCDLDDIDIPLYFDYFPVSLPIDVNQGRANGKLQISFSPDQEKGSKLKIQFSLTTEELALESRNSKLSLKVPIAKFEGSLEPFNQSLAIQNILLREPTLNSDGIITRETLANLVPLTMRPEPDDPLYQIIPSISVKLLIADGGSVIIKKSGENKPVRIWHSVQLSVKNFSNTQLLPSEEENSFRLSAEQLSSSAFFTWQGQFDKQNRPGGNLQLNNIDAATIAPFLGRESKDVKGTADISGLLSLALQDEGDLPFDYTLKSTRVIVKNLKLSDNGTEWLSVPTLRSEPVSRINNVTDLGNIFLQNSLISLESSSLPLLFQRFSKRPTEHVIHGIDFSGTIRISDKTRHIDALEFTDTILQANRLEQQQISEENFVFSATVNKTGGVKATGSLHIAPLQLSSEIAFSKLRPGELLSWFSNSSLFSQSQAVISGQGTFRYPQIEYQGVLSAEKITLGDQQSPLLQVAKAHFDKISWSQTAQKLDINYMLIDQPEFSWIRTRDADNPLPPLSYFLRHLFLPETDDSVQSSENPPADFSLAINQIDFNNGIVTYQDKRITPPLALEVSAINGNLSKINYPAKKDSSSFEFTGNLAGQPFNVAGTGLLIQGPPNLQAVFSAQSLPLSLFSSQISHKFQDIDPSKGAVNIKTSIQFSNGKDKLSTTISVSDLLPKNSGTPTALALSLLTSADGTFPFEMEAEEIEQKAILSEALNSLGTSIIKASINPILLTGEDFKDLVDKQYLSFAPGSSQISAESIERINRFSEFLGSHPLTKLRFTGYADKIEDYTALYNDLVDLERNQTDQKNRLLRQEWEKQKEAIKLLIEKQLAEQSSEIQETNIPVSELPEFVPIAPRQVEVTDTMLQLLATEREKNVLDFLLDQLAIPENRVEPADPTLNRVKNDAAYSRVDISLSDLYSDMIQ